MPPFHNPYHFVPLGPGHPPESVALDDFTKPQAERKAPHLTHDRFVPGAHSGRIVCKLTVETPLLCGNQVDDNQSQTRPDGELNPRFGWTKLIKPFELDGQAALPGSSLRGMLSALAEAASHSALRILKPDVLSYRRLTSDERKLSAIGIIESGAKGQLQLRPLAMPTMEQENGSYGFFGSPADSSYVGDDQRFPGVFPEPSFKVYLGRRPYSQGDYRDPAGQPLRNVTADAAGNVGPFYGMRLTGPAPIWQGASMDTVAGGLPWQRHPTRRNQQGQRVPNPAFLIGHKPVDPLQVVPWVEGMENQGFIRGIFRGLGLWTAERQDACPSSKYHELFIPFTPAMENWSALPILPSAIERFDQLSRQRTEDDPHHLLPFEPIGTRPRRNGAPMDLRPGDVVYFLPNKAGAAVEELSFSSMWRGRVEDRDDTTGVATGSDIHRFLSEVSSELLPLCPERTLLTLAEQLFGAVEEGEKKTGENPHGDQSFAFASRLRISHGRLHSASPSGAFQPASELSGATCDVPLQNLASPKPPSPTLYFKKKNGQGAYIPKKLLNPKEHRPQGRKFYLRRDPGAYKPASEAFVHPARLDEDRDAIANQHQSVEKFVRKGTTFFFHLDFDNLSNRELQLLAYVLEPSPSFRHQLGHGKPLGLGQVKIEIAGLLKVKRRDRYVGSLTASRWHQAWAADSPLSDWPRDLQRHLQTDPPLQFDSLPEKLASLHADFESWAATHGLTHVLRALELLGTPLPATAKVHYPQAAEVNRGNAANQNWVPVLAGSADFEREHYQWFVQNDRYPGQYLRPLTNAEDQVASSIPALHREQTDQPPPATYKVTHGGGPGGPGAGGAGAGLLPPQSLHLQIVQNCIVTAHKTTRNKLQILFAVPSTSLVIGLLENPGTIPNAALRFKPGWTGPMKVLDPKRVQGSWQCTLRPA